MSQCPLETTFQNSTQMISVIDLVLLLVILTTNFFRIQVQTTDECAVPAHVFPKRHIDARESFCYTKANWNPLFADSFLLVPSRVRPLKQMKP